MTGLRPPLRPFNSGGGGLLGTRTQTLFSHSETDFPGLLNLFSVRTRLMAGSWGRLPGAGLDRPAREWGGDSGRAVAPGFRDSSGPLGPRSGPARAWRPGTVPAQWPLLPRGGRGVPRARPGSMFPTHSGLGSSGREARQRAPAPGRRADRRRGGDSSEAPGEER